MKNFFLKLFVFFVVVVSVDFILGHVLKTINDGVQKGDYGRNNFIMTGLRDKDILVFGSSRAIHHYDPQILSDSLGMSCYNCGEDGMGILLSYSRLTAILSRYTPRVIIYDVEIAFDIAKDDNGRYLGKLNLFYPNYGLRKIYTDVSSTEKFKMISKLYRYNSQVVEILIQRVSSSPDLAKDATYYPLTGQLNYMPDTPKPFDVDRDSLKIHYLESFITMCKENHIQLFFAVSPKFLVRHDRELSILKEMCNRNCVPVLNHYNDTSYTMHQELFVDPAHLNSIGSEKFTKTIASEIKRSLKKRIF